MTGRQQLAIGALVVGITAAIAYGATHYLRHELFPVELGSKAPDFTAFTLDSTPKRKTLADYRGQVLMINVWATWCLPCRKEMPELERLRPGLAADKIDLVGLNVDSDPQADLRGFLREHRVGYPIYVGGVPSIERLYATDELSVPMSILVDDRGVVQEVFPGWSEKTQKRFAALSGRRE